ncbi:MAG: PfkB family carbohydrate kinase [Proteobacteria bacterium]|nr:PfkB family carbohydrate kinase [Pseudomonadota bacterium]
MPTRMHTLACIGGALVDRVVTRGRATLTLGGVCTNLARHLLSMGLGCELHSCVGTDAHGDRVRAWLEEAGVPHKLHVQQGSTGEVYLAYGANGHLEETFCDTALLDALSSQDARPWLPFLVDKPVWIMDTDLPESFLEALLEEAPQGTKLYLTTVTPEKTRRVPQDLSRLEALFMNADELCFATGCGDSLETGAHMYLARGASCVFVTQGAKGAGCFSQHASHFEESLPFTRPLASTHGAGDAFTAGAIAHMIQGPSPYENALKAGMLGAKEHLDRLNPCLHTA